MKHLRKFDSAELMDAFVASYTFTKEEPMVLACEGSLVVSYSSEHVIVGTHLIYADGTDAWIDEIPEGYESETPYIHFSNIPNFYECVELITDATEIPIHACGDKYDGNRTTFPILKKVTMPNVTYIAKNAFRYCSSLTSVGDLSNVTSISYSAFIECTKLTSVDLSNVLSIGTSAFSHCTSLTSVDLSNVTSIGMEAFIHCTSLTSVGDLSNVSRFENGCFYCCSALSSVDLSNATLIANYTFQYCSSLTSVTLPSIPPNLINANSFDFCPCTFYIPQGSKQAYLSAKNWSTYDVSRFVEI